MRAWVYEQYCPRTRPVPCLSQGYWKKPPKKEGFDWWEGMVTPARGRWSHCIHSPGGERWTGGPFTSLYLSQDPWPWDDATRSEWVFLPPENLSRSSLTDIPDVSFVGDSKFHQVESWDHPSHLCIMWPGTNFLTFLHFSFLNHNWEIMSPVSLRSEEEGQCTEYLL